VITPAIANVFLHLSSSAVKASTLHLMASRCTVSPSLRSVVVRML